MSLNNLALQVPIGTHNPSVTLPIIKSPHCHLQHISTPIHTNPIIQSQPHNIQPTNAHNINPSNPHNYKYPNHINMSLIGNTHESIPSTSLPNYAPTIPNQHTITHLISAHSHTDVNKTTPPDTYIQPPPSQYNTTTPKLLHAMTRFPRPLPSQGNGRRIHSTTYDIPAHPTTHPRINTTHNNQYEIHLHIPTTHDNTDSAYPPSLLNNCNNDRGAAKVVHPNDTNCDKQSDDDNNPSPRHPHEYHNPGHPPSLSDHRDINDGGRTESSHTHTNDNDAPSTNSTSLNTSPTPNPDPTSYNNELPQYNANAIGAHSDDTAPCVEEITTKLAHPHDTNYY